jgi:hypothetical protein
MLARFRKTLADATLSNGARLVSSGGGLPQRITTAADIVLAGVAELRSGVVFDPDGLHVWVPRRTTGDIRKIRISDGSVITTLTTNVSSPENISRALGSSNAFVASSGNTKALKIDLNAATISDFVSPTASPYHVVEGSSGKAWVRTSNSAAAVYTEFTLATGVATGRTLASAWDLHADLTNAKLFSLASSGAVLKIDEAANTTDLTWTAPGTAIHGAPAWSNAQRALIVDSSRRPIVIDTAAGHAYRYAAGSNAIDKRLLFGATDFGQPPGSTIGAARFQRQFMAFSDNDQKVAWLQPNSSGAISDAIDVRVIDIRTARARWTLNTTVSMLVKEISAGGAFGNLYAAVTTPPNGFSTSAYDYRRTRWYYSTNGGGSRTEFTPGDDLSVAVAAGGALTVDADMCSWEMPLPTLAPWIGGTSGEGIGVIAQVARPADQLYRGVA